jgi:hypothetical protein
MIHPFQVPRIQGFFMAINRTRRNILERRCVSKSVKRLFKGLGKTMFKTMYAVECQQRSRKPLGN